MYEARDYYYLLTILKTPRGYLTKNGFTQDINSDGIIVLRGYVYGQYSSMTTRVQFFLEKATLSEDVSKELYKVAQKCEVMAYRCEVSEDCENCQYYASGCQFWEKNRAKIRLFKLYYF